MKNWMKGIFTLVLLTGIVSVVAVSCSDDDDVECAAGHTKVTLGASCQEFFSSICNCSPRPAEVEDADCAAVKQGFTCAEPGDEELTDEDCKNIQAFIAQNNTDVCTADLSGGG